MAKEEEVDWPPNWVKKGTERGSEWVQELAYDDRVISRMRVFDVKSRSNTTCIYTSIVSAIMCNCKQTYLLEYHHQSLPLP